MPRQYTPKVELVCCHCGTPFRKAPSQVRGKKSYCSSACKYAGRETPLPEHFAARVAADPDTGCLLWAGQLNNRGYGILDRRSCGDGILLAHRVAWQLTNGAIPAGVEVCHNCPGGDNPRCVNPAHLFLGTHADNMEDAGHKQQMAHGEQHPHARLTDEQIRYVLSQPREYGSGHRLALELGVSDSTISEVRNRKRWRHVD